MATLQPGSLIAAAANVPAARVPAPRPGAGEAPRAGPAVSLPAAAAPPQAAAPPPASPAVDANAVREALDDAFTRIRAFLGTSNSALEFAVDDASGRTVVRVMDSQTKELIRQIPSDEVLAIARTLDRLQGLFLRQQA